MNHTFSKRNFPLESNPLYCRLMNMIYQISILRPFLGTKREILTYFLNVVARERSFTTINGQHEGQYRAIKSVRLEILRKIYSINSSGKVIQNSRHSNYEAQMHTLKRSKAKNFNNGRVAELGKFLFRVLSLTLLYCLQLQR